MAETVDNSIKKTRISLSRNKPVALVVGAASFLGSHLADKLLDKNIQVIGVDDLEKGEKRNLLKAAGNSNFHLVIESPDDLEADLGRLDYIFIASSGKWHLDKILALFKKFSSRCLLVSSIDLYEKDRSGEKLGQLKNMESKIAKFAGEFNLNARVLRLGPVFGPRMDFEVKDPLVRLIQQTLTGDLHKDTTLEFSSRALYVEDAIDLIIRTIFAGSTSQKIFDGVSLVPVKVAEIKQVLMDPVWYETRDFVPGELPPWPTPNLDRSVKFLNWHPQAKLVASLRETLSYFKDNEINIPKAEEAKTETEKTEWQEEKKAELASFKQALSQEEPKKQVTPKFSVPWSKISFILIVLLVGYALIWPGVVLGWSLFNFRYGVESSLRDLQAGEFDKSLNDVRQAKASATAVKSLIDSMEPMQQLGLFKNEFELGDKLVNMAILSTSSLESTVRGMQALLQSVKAITGEGTESPAPYLAEAQTELTSASNDLSLIYASAQDPSFSKQLPTQLVPISRPLLDKLAQYSSLVSRAQAMSILLPSLTAADGSKSYLVLLQNNMELRGSGGFIGSFAKVSFEGGKLKTLSVNDIYNIDGQLKIHVEPPKEIKEDLGQKDWFLRDSNFEPDFPTAARQAEWFYTKETGERVAGVVALDVSAMEDLLGVIGPLDLPDYNKQITEDNLFSEAISHAEMSFFPGSQAKKSFITALSTGVFDKIFFLPQNNWPGIIASLGRSLDSKHISIYLDDPKLFSYILSQNFAHVLPRETKDNQNQDFLSPIEANLGANKVNYYLGKSYNLETVIGKEGEVSHRLRISYTNRSPSDAFPGGTYKNRMRVYLPFGAKLVRALWGEADISKNTTSFVDYGRSGYSMLLELKPKEQKTLVLDYSVPQKMQFKDGKASYRLDIIKQAGTLKDPLQWTITYPITYKVVSNQTKTVGPQEQTIQTDLSTDRSFQIEFKK